MQAENRFAVIIPEKKGEIFIRIRPKMPHSEDENSFFKNPAFDIVYIKETAAQLITIMI